MSLDKTPDAAENGHWLPLAQLLPILDISRSRFYTRVRPAVGKRSVRKDGKRYLFHAPRVLRVYLEQEMELRRLGRKRRRASLADPEDLEAETALLCSTDSSPALERWRKARALREELALRRDRGEVIDRAEVHEVLVHIMQLLRSQAEVFKRSFAPGVVQAFNEILERTAQQIERRFGSTDQEA